MEFPARNTKTSPGTSSLLSICFFLPSRITSTYVGNMLFKASVARLAARSCQKLNKPLITLTSQMAIPSSSVPDTIAIKPEIQSKIAIILVKFFKKVRHSDSAAAFFISLRPYFFNRLSASSCDKPSTEECKLIKTSLILF